MDKYFLQTINDIKKWLIKYQIKDYIINSDLTVDVNDHVILCSNKLKKIPFQFGKINGVFDCSNNQLISFKGFPLEAISIIASNNKFKNTNNFSSIVKKNVLLYDCYNLESITDLPTLINGNIIIDISTTHTNFKANFSELYNDYYIDGILQINANMIEKMKLKKQLETELINNSENQFSKKTKI